METKKIPRSASIAGIYLVDSFVDRLCWFPALSDFGAANHHDLINSLPSLVSDFEKNATAFLENTPFQDEMAQITDNTTKYHQ